MCEPQCHGFEHAQFNAALLATVLHAFPRARVLFLAEPGHLDWVRSAVSENAASIAARVVFQPLALPPPDLSYWGWFTPAAYWRDRSSLRAVRAVLAAEGADLLILSSVTGTGLLAWKASQGFGPGTPTIAIPHAILGTLARTRIDLPRLAQRPRWWRDLGHLAVRLRLGPALAVVLTRLASLRRILMAPPARTIRYVALGAPILHALREADPPLAARFEVLDLPTFLHEPAQAATVPPTTVRFGFFGVGYKGFASFARLAGAIRPGHAHARFDLVGYLNTPEDPRSHEGVVEGVGAVPLPREEFEARARAVTYAVWTADPTRYRFTASASFVDALSFGKPGIYLRSSFVAHYFDRMGDIGYLCDSLEEAQGVMESILQRFPIERYAAQQRAIAAGRGIFAPEALAGRLGEIAAAAR